MDIFLRTFQDEIGQRRGSYITEHGLKVVELISPDLVFILYYAEL